MKQLALELSTPPQPAFTNFVAGRNAELVAALRAIAQGSSAERFLYVWGVHGSGRSHLLRAAIAARRAQGREAAYLVADAANAALVCADPDALFALDDVEGLDACGESALFGLYNRMREGCGVLVASGAAAPAGLGLRADLATRLAWGLVYEVHALSDEEKAEAMSARAQARGYTLPSEVRDYVLTHGRRDLAYLLAMVDQIDRHSLESHRAITLPLAREVLLAEAEDKEMK